MLNNILRALAHQGLPGRKPRATPNIRLIFGWAKLVRIAVYSNRIGDLIGRDPGYF